CDPQTQSCSDPTCDPSSQSCNQSKQPPPDSVAVSKQCAQAIKAILGATSAPKLGSLGLLWDPNPVDFEGATGPCTQTWFDYSVPPCQMQIRCADSTAKMPDRSSCKCGKGSVPVREMRTCDLVKQCPSGQGMRLDASGCGC